MKCSNDFVFRVIDQVSEASACNSEFPLGLLNGKYFVRVHLVVNI